MVRDFIVFVNGNKDGLCVECCKQRREDAGKRVMGYGSQMGRGMSK